MPNIEPRTLKGFRDFLPKDQIARQKLMGIIRLSYESFGFEPLETPALEYADILTGKYGDEGDKLMYRFKDNGDRDVALRYDLTIPLARVAAQYDNDLKKPWKRYQMSPVWRAENTQKGRFREFYQCDVDIVGTLSEDADSEILALASSTLRKLGVTDFVIRVNSREILNAFYGSLGLDAAAQVNVLRAVDKMDKIGADKVREELVGLSISKETADAVIEFSASRASDQAELLALGKKFSLGEPIIKLASILSTASFIEEGLKWVVDFSIARGLDYYTGLIFETNLLKAPQFGSVLSGGRYDNLVGIFANRPMPAVGASIGLDRLLAALQELGVMKEEKTVTKVMIANFGVEYKSRYVFLAQDLRVAGINTITYFDPVDLKKQLSYASDKGIRFAVLYGENERKDDIVVIKDLEKGVQEKVKKDEVVAVILRALSE